LKAIRRCEAGMMDDSKVVDLAHARRAKQVDAKPCSRTEPADRSAQRGKYMAFLCSHLVDQLDRVKEGDFDWRAAARAALEANLLGRAPLPCSPTLTKRCHC